MRGHTFGTTGGGNWENFFSSRFGKFRCNPRIQWLEKLGIVDELEIACYTIPVDWY